MQNRKQIENSIKLITSLKRLATAYEQISVTKMQRARGGVLSSRSYLEELTKVFNQVKSNYNEQVQKLLVKKHHDGSVTYSTLNKNGQSIAILLSTNSKLHGDIGRKVFRQFVDNLKAHNPDIYIIGKVGKELFDAAGVEKEYKYIDFPDLTSEREFLVPISEVLEQYENVTVYYGKFVNVLTQSASATNISGTPPIGNVDYQPTSVHFYFEPSLETVLQFFESQIFASLLKQTLHESALSNDASRIQQMELALENIEDSSLKLINAKRKIKKRVDNAKQIQRLLGRRLWHQA